MTSAIITAITAVFSAVGDWIRNAIQAMVPIFWTAGEGNSSGSLTFLGVTALVSLGFGVCFLIVGIIQNFLKLRS